MGNKHPIKIQEQRWKTLRTVRPFVFLVAGEHELPCLLRARKHGPGAVCIARAQVSTRWLTPGSASYPREAGCSRLFFSFSFFPHVGRRGGAFFFSRLGGITWAPLDGFAWAPWPAVTSGGLDIECTQASVAMCGNVGRIVCGWSEHRAGGRCCREDCRITLSWWPYPLSLCVHCLTWVWVRSKPPGDRRF